jgi:Asp/Glu/hydantoin racemase
MSKKRALVLVPGHADQTQRIGEALLREAKVRDGVQFEFKAVRLSPIRWDSAQDWLVGEIGYFEAAADAQSEGYDAVCVLSAGDMAINQLRSVLDIPVVGGGKLGYLAALMVGTRFSLLIHWEPWRYLYKDAIDAYGLGSLCASIRSMFPSIEKEDVGVWTVDENEREITRIIEVGRQCIDEDGADVLCLPVGLYWTYNKLQSNVPVPVINAGAVMLKFVEALLDLGLTHSRVGFPKASTLEVEMFHEMVSAAVAHRASRH